MNTVSTLPVMFYGVLWLALAAVALLSCETSANSGLSLLTVACC